MNTNNLKSRLSVRTNNQLTRVRHPLIMLTAVLAVSLGVWVSNVRSAAAAGPDTPAYYAGTYTQGGDNAFSDYWVPTSHHPSGWTYINFSKDASFLNVSVEVTGDNTDDVEDWSSLTIGGTEYRIDDNHSTWGTCPFGSTDHVGYAHATCEFHIPLAQLPAGDFPFVLRYYGTFSGPSIPDLQAIDDTGISNNDNFTSETDLTFDEPCQSYAWAYLYRDDTTPGNYVDAAECIANSAVLEDLSVPEGAYAYHVRYGVDGTGSTTVAGDPASVHVDTTAPTVESGAITGANEATINFDEGVYGLMCDYGGVCGDSGSTLTVNGDDIRSITASSGNGTELITLTFGGDPVTAGATGTITLNQPPPDTIADQAGNELASNTEVDLNGSNEVWVDDNFTDDSNDGGHDWAFDAFDTIQAGLNAVGEGGTIHVAPGNYYPDSYYEIEKSVTIEGDVGDESRGPGIGAPVLYPDTCDPPLINVNANDVTIRGVVVDNESCPSRPDIRVSQEVTGFYLNDSELTGGKKGVDFSPNASDNTITNNLIHDLSQYGVWIGGASDNLIENNEIYGMDGEEGAGVAFGAGGCDGECVYDVSGNVVSGNNIHDNGFGVYWNAGDQESQVTIGSGNDIHDNCDNIYINDNSTNLVITGNSIHDNTCPDSGLHVGEVDTGQLRAAGNWWGSENGPSTNYDPEANPDGDGEDIVNVSYPGFDILFRPFCLDSECTELSDVGTGDIGNLFDAGAFSIPDGENADSVSSISATSDLTINIASSSVVIPAGTDITKTGGGTFDGTTLGGSDPDLSSLSGFSGTAKGALEWGADVGLTFDPAITLNIFVGTDLNGKTLQVKRSPDGGSTWTQDGIEPPKSCTVTAGICTFQATKASIYVSTSSGSSGGSSGNYISPTPTPVPGSDLHGLHEGDVFSASEGDPDVYIVNTWGYKRLFLNPVIFNFYGHLGGWSVVKHTPGTTRDSFPTSGLFRNCETDDQAVYAIEVTGEDTGTLHHVQMSGDAAVAQDPNFFKKVFCINNNEFNWYSKSPIDYTSLSQVPVYVRH